MARIRHVRIDTTVSAVCSATLLWGLVDLDVFDDEFRGVEAFGVGIRFGVLQKTDQKFGGFDGPARFGDAELLAWEDVELVVVDVDINLRHEIRRVILLKTFNLKAG
jgi:hypothetical protein